MKKRLIILAILTAFILTAYTKASAFTDETQYKLVCTKGVCITYDTAVYAGEYKNIKSERFTSAQDSYAVLIGADIIDIAPGTSVDVDDSDGLFLREGVIGIQPQKGDTEVHTKTERAYISADGKAVIRVDDYGNAFNYCIKGTLRLVSTDDGKDVSIDEGEYVAVTVKRGIKTAKKYAESDIVKTGIIFTESIDDAEMGKTEALKTDIIEYDFGTEGSVCSIKTNTVCKFKNTAEDTVSAILYLSCGVNDAGLTIYNQNLELLSKSSLISGSAKPNVRITSNSGSEFYVYVSSANEAEYTLFSQKYISVYQRAFNILKKLALPAVAALLVFFIYGIFKDGKKPSKKPKY